MKCILRSTENNAINIPSEIWKRAGWKLNDVLELTIGEMFNVEGESRNCISIDRTEDLVKCDDDYPYGDIKGE